MPIYEFGCECGFKVEIITKISGGRPCPSCGLPMRRLVSAPANTPDKWKVITEPKSKSRL